MPNKEINLGYLLFAAGCALDEIQNLPEPECTAVKTRVLEAIQLLENNQAPDIWDSELVFYGTTLPQTFESKEYKLDAVYDFFNMLILYEP